MINTHLDWHSDKLDLATLIDKNYKSTQNVRRFFKLHLGNDFHFNRSFMAWMKENSGKTLAAAIEEFKNIKNG